MTETAVRSFRRFADRLRPGARSAVPVAVCALLASLVGGLTACGGGEPSAPVARVDVGEAELILPHGGRATLETVWHPAAPLDGDDGAAVAEPVVFVHLLGPDGALARTFDHPFPEPWTPGQPVHDAVALWQSAFAPPLDPGRYTLTIGLVDGATGRRWPLDFGEGGEGGDGAPEMVDRGEYAVATVTVPEPASTPEVAFTGSWLPPDELPDRQVLRTRMLTGTGSVVLRRLERPLELELVLHVPLADETGYRLVPEEGQEPGAEPTVVVDSPCSPEPARITGRGTRRAQLLLRPPGEGQGEGGECAVRIEPEFVLVDPVSFDRITVQLRRLTWAPPRGSTGASAPATDRAAEPTADGRP